MLLQAGLQGLPEVGIVARFGEEAEDVALVHRLDGRAQVGVAREHDPDAVLGYLPHFPEKRDAVHLWHPLVRDHHGEGPGSLEGVQPRLGPEGCFQVVVHPQVALEGVKDILLVVHEEDAIAHTLLLSG